MELGEPDASAAAAGSDSDSEFMIDVDTVIVAIGNGPNPLVRAPRRLEVDPAWHGQNEPGHHAHHEGRRVRRGDIAIGARP